MTHWYDYKKEYTAEQERDLWQYFMDHSKMQPNGYWQILFYVKDVNDFWRRLHYRHTGEFKRYDIVEKQAISNKYAYVRESLAQLKVLNQQHDVVDRSVFRPLWRLMLRYARWKMRNGVDKV